MPFPALTRQTGRTNYSVGTGQPDNGVNEFAHNWNIPVDQISEDAIELEYTLLGASVTAISYVGLSADKLSLQVNFTQAGTDQVRVDAKHIHSIAR